MLLIMESVKVMMNQGMLTSGDLSIVEISCNVILFYCSWY